jgi:hypothetical protein
VIPTIPVAAPAAGGVAAPAGAAVGAGVAAGTDCEATGPAKTLVVVSVVVAEASGAIVVGIVLFLN